MLLTWGLFSYGQPGKKLAEAFIQSVAKHDFQILNPYMSSTTTGKNIWGKEFISMSPQKQAERILQNRMEIFNDWMEVVNTAKKNKIDFGKVKVKEVLFAPAYDLRNFMLVAYDYNGVVWDDLTFHVNKQGASKYLIAIVGYKKIFALNETEREKTLKHFKSLNDINDSQDLNIKNNSKIKQQLIAAVVILKKLVTANDKQQLYTRLAYTGEDDNTNRWKRIVDPSKPEDVESSKKMITKLMNSLTQCDKMSYGDVRIEKESEGTWYVITANCGNKKIRTHF